MMLPLRLDNVPLTNQLLLILFYHVVDMSIQRRLGWGYYLELSPRLPIAGWMVREGEGETREGRVGELITIRSVQYSVILVIFVVTWQLKGSGTGTSWNGTTLSLKSCNLKRMATSMLLVPLPLKILPREESRALVATKHNR